MTDPDMEALRQAVIRTRRERGLSLRELERLTDIAFSAIGHFERGHTKTLTTYTRKKFEAWLAGDDPLQVSRNRGTPVAAEVTLPILEALIARVVAREVRTALEPYCQALTALVLHKETACDDPLP